MMRSDVRRAYVDASVFGGAFDEEFAKDSGVFFDQLRQGRFSLVTSGLVGDEIAGAPHRVRELYESLLPQAVSTSVDAGAIALQSAYLSAGILSPKWGDDALHVALATIHGADLIVSWNFRHIVHFEKVIRYNAVNVLNGYREIAIHTPSEVIAYEDEDI